MFATRKASPHMRVLTIYAHHNPRSFCHAVLERFTAGLREHEYFHAVHGADDATLRAYLDRAYQLGREF